MKQAVPIPVVAIVVSVIVLAVGFLLYRQSSGPSHANAAAASSGRFVPPPHMKKPDFSSMSPDQIEAMKRGGMGAMRSGGTK